MKKYLLILAILLINSLAFSQNGVRVNNANTTPEYSDILYVSFSNKGVLLTRVSLTGIAFFTISLLIYNTATSDINPTELKKINRKQIMLFNYA